MNPVSAPASALRASQLTQHLSSALLLTVCSVRSVTSGAKVLWVVPLVIVLLTIYLVGPALARRTAGGRWAPMVWLLALTLAWLALLAVSLEFAWLSFVLWLLAGHVLGRWWGIGYSVAILAVVILARAEYSSAAIIGPVMGCLFAFGLSRGQLALIRTQAQLAEVSREAGVIAERTRLSRDIHDTLAQGFTSILLLSRAGLNPAADKDVLLRQIEQTAADNLEESRRMVAALAPAALEDQTLGAAITRIVAAFEAETGIATSADTSPLPPLPTEVEVAALRVVQSALANVRQHSQADQARVSLATESDGQLQVRVSDDGVGFDPAELAAGYGLTAMRARLSELGGSLDLTSTAAGTTVLATLPTGSAS